jgi:predicted transposase/invertase (TIGR01784 family)
VLQGKTRVNVEVQLRNQRNMDRRSLFYWSREYMKSLKAGEDYHDLPDVITVNIVDFNFPPPRKYHTCFHLREDNEPNLILTNSLEIHFINMVQYRKLRKRFDGFLGSDPLIRWLAWFNKNSPPELIAEVKKMDSAIQLADERLVYLSGNEDAIRAYEMRFKAMCDLTSMRNHAIRTGHAKGFKKGIEKGMAEGHEQEKLEIARKMKAANRPLTEITQFTGLSMETIEQL